MKKIGKYEFDDSVQADSKINALGTKTTEFGEVVPSHNHHVVRLGYITLQEGEYNMSGEQITAPVLSDKYHVDVLWKDIDEHPRGWKTYSVDMDSNGVHAFAGLNYTDYKF